MLNRVMIFVRIGEEVEGILVLVLLSVLSLFTIAIRTDYGIKMLKFSHNIKLRQKNADFFYNTWVRLDMFFLLPNLMNQVNTILIF